MSWDGRFILYWPLHSTHTPWMLCKCLLSGGFKAVWFSNHYDREIDRLPLLIRMCKRFGVEVIYSRWLWPGSVGDNVEKAVYWHWMRKEAIAQQIALVQSRAAELGCLSAVDPEVYNGYKAWSTSELLDPFSYEWLVKQVDGLTSPVDYAIGGFWARSATLPIKAFHKLGVHTIIDRTYYRGPDYGSIIPACDRYSDEIEHPWAGGQIVVSDTPQPLGGSSSTTWTLDTLDEACEVLEGKEILLYLARSDHPERVVDGLLERSRG